MDLCALCPLTSKSDHPSKADSNKSNCKDDPENHTRRGTSFCVLFCGLCTVVEGGTACVLACLGQGANVTVLRTHGIVAIVHCGITQSNLINAVPCLLLDTTHIPIRDEAVAPVEPLTIKVEGKDTVSDFPGIHKPAVSCDIALTSLWGDIWELGSFRKSKQYFKRCCRCRGGSRGRRLRCCLCR